MSLKKKVYKRKQKNGVHGNREASVKMLMQKKKKGQYFSFSANIKQIGRGKKYRYY